MHSERARDLLTFVVHSLSESTSITSAWLSVVSIFSSNSNYNKVSSFLYSSCESSTLSSSEIA